MADELRPPIILFGNFRSGTTLIQKLIATHPDVVAWNEPVSLWLYGDPARKHDEFDEKDATDRVKRYVRKKFLQYQRENGGPIIVEKTPHNILKIPYVRAIFPEARFLYVVRNPLSYISSVELKWRRPAGAKRLKKRFMATPPSQLHHYLWRFLNQQWNNRILGRKYLSIWGVRYKGIQDDLGKENLTTVIARQWARAAAKAEKDLVAFDDDQVLRFRYEDFIKDPVAHVERICAHCGLEMTDEMARIVKETVKTDRTLKWKRLDPAVLAQAIPELAAEMKLNGYEVPEELAHPR